MRMLEPHIDEETVKLGDAEAVARLINGAANG